MVATIYNESPFISAGYSLKRNQNWLLGLTKVLPTVAPQIFVEKQPISRILAYHPWVVWQSPAGCDHAKDQEPNIAVVIDAASLIIPLPPQPLSGTQGMSLDAPETLQELLQSVHCRHKVEYSHCFHRSPSLNLPFSTGRTFSTYPKAYREVCSALFPNGTLRFPLGSLKHSRFPDTKVPRIPAAK